MQDATVDWAEFAPPAPPAQLRALVLAIVAHVLLLGALAWGVNWRSQTDNTLSVDAELWSAVPREAAPRPEAVLPPTAPPEPKPAPAPRPAPPPPPPDVAQRNADIALARQKQEAEALAAKQKLEQEQKKRLKLEAEKKEAEKRALEQKRLALEKLEKDRLKLAVEEKKAAEKKVAQEAQRKEALKLEAQKKEEAAKAEKDLKAQREANLRRLTGLAGATGNETATGTALRSSAPSASYGGRVAARVKPNIVFTDEIASNPTAEVEVRTSPDGSILSRKLTRSSGFKAWDEAVLKAIDKTDKLPLDTDGRVPPALIISFRPKD